MEYCSNLSWHLSCVTSFIFETERAGFVQPRDKKALGGLSSSLSVRRLLRGCSQALHSGKLSHMAREQETVNINIRTFFFTVRTVKPGEPFATVIKVTSERDVALNVW